jgi:hypothetical protein
VESPWRKEAWFDIINLAAAVFLVFSPWIFEFTAAAEANRNTWISGAVIGITSGAAIFAFAEWEDWASFVLGLWLIVSPWLLRFHDTVPSAMRVDIATGIVVAVFATGALWLTHREPTGIAARQ